jgi:5'-3' exonuclease
MILLFDADSLIWSSCYKKKENPEDNPFQDNLEDATAKFDEVFMSIINKLEESYDVEKVLVFNGSLGNFRKLITPKYKANRINTPKPILLQEMHQWVKENYNSIYGYGVETDDLVAKYWSIGMNYLKK